jgi:hypothetical protein
MSYRLVTVENAKLQLSILHSADDAYVESLCDRASEIVMNYLGDSFLLDDADWLDTDGNPIVEETTGDPSDPTAIPGSIQQATLVLIARLDWDREGVADPISPAVMSLLARYRDPPL